MQPPEYLVCAAQILVFVASKKFFCFPDTPTWIPTIFDDHHSLIVKIRSLKMISCVGQAARLYGGDRSKYLFFRYSHNLSCFHRISPMRWIFLATTANATWRLNPSMPWLGHMSSPCTSSAFIADSTAECACRSSRMHTLTSSSTATPAFPLLIHPVCGSKIENTFSTCGIASPQGYRDGSRVHAACRNPHSNPASPHRTPVSSTVPCQADRCTCSLSVRFLLQAIGISARATGYPCTDAEGLLKSSVYHPVISRQTRSAKYRFRLFASVDFALRASSLYIP